MNIINRYPATVLRSPYMKYRIRVTVKEVKGKCALGYKTGDMFIIEQYYIEPVKQTRICLHALSSMLTLISPFLKGIPGKDLGIGKEEDVGYVQCPDPGPPYTCGGTVVFELKRETLNE